MDAEKQAVLVEAVEKAKAETFGGTDSTTVEDLSRRHASALEDISKRHAEELKALEEKLRAQYAADMKAHADKAVEEALRSRPVLASATNPEAQKLAVDAAIAEFKKKLETQHAEEIASAVDRGRMEQVAKGKLKDSQLVKAQKRVKDLEAQIAEWQAAGVVPAITPATTAPATTPTQAATKPPPTAPAAASAGVATPAPIASGPSQNKPNPAAAANVAAVNNAANLPRRPLGGNVGTSGGVSTGRGGAAGRARGGPPGLARGGAMQRTAPVRTAPQAAAAGAAAPVTGVSIIGAAGKRPHDDAAGSADGSLAKRLKPAQPQ